MYTILNGRFHIIKGIHTILEEFDEHIYKSNFTSWSQPLSSFQWLCFHSSSSV